MVKDNKKDESKYCGKHIGSCDKCNFSLLADKDTNCPRCNAKVHKNTIKKGGDHAKRATA